MATLKEKSGKTSIAPGGPEGDSGSVTVGMPKAVFVVNVELEPI